MCRRYPGVLLNPICLAASSGVENPPSAFAFVLNRPLWALPFCVYHNVPASFLSYVYCLFEADGLVRVSLDDILRDLEPYCLQHRFEYRPNPELLLTVIVVL